MKQQPLVTIGIPAYNTENFIGWAIKSVLNQTYTNLELIITDDGSTDRTVEIANSFNDPRIIVLSDGENYGISYRLNQQIDLAKGKYFARMDADDIMFPDRIERQVKYMEINPDVDAISGGAIVIDETNQILGGRGRTEIPLQMTSERWGNGMTLIHPTVIGRLEYFKKYKYLNDFKGVEDRDLWFRSCANAKIIELPEYYIFYRDPLRFKLKTYLFRRKQNRKQWRSKVIQERYGKKKCNKVIRMSYLRSITSTVLYLIKLDRLMMKRRNQTLNPDIESHYSRLIQNQV